MRLALSCLALWASSAVAAERFHVLHPADVAKLLSTEGGTAKARVFIYDVNVESTRTHVGVIPGAQLLDSSSAEELLGKLPSDKSSRLIFYCANTYCTASHQAANRALDSGYTDVNVMVDGIYGWRDAGMALRKLAPAPTPLLPSKVLSLQKAGTAIVVDVREGEERHEVIDQARWLPMSRANSESGWSEFVQSLPKAKTVVVFYCAAGVRAKQAAERLRSDGFTTAYFDGPDQWKAAGLPLKPGPAP